jgi:hypothetical protein
MQLADIYTHADLVECPATYATMLAHSQELVESQLRPQLERMAWKIYRGARSRNQNLLESSSQGQFVGGVVGLVLSHVRPQLLESVVYDTPTESLAHLRAYFDQKRRTTQT